MGCGAKMGQCLSVYAFICIFAVYLFKRNKTIGVVLWLPQLAYRFRSILLMGQCRNQTCDRNLANLDLGE